jgi:peptidoglycan-N-acetylglucosamine deacetylase
MSVTARQRMRLARSGPWTGPVCSGPRRGNRVALTFDDGPNDPHTLHIADILEAHGVRGTFFVVGKAVDARPDIVRALLERGHLVGGHSQSHRWRDPFVPSYPELARSQGTFRTRLGVTPAFFRPPHGLWTPFLTRAATRAGVRVVNWDVMAWDWSARDSSIIAKRVLERAQAGSIVLLHDGCDGDLTTDRSPTAAALPVILAGLARRDLVPVRLDDLLGGPAYLDAA